MQERRGPRCRSPLPAGRLVQVTAPGLPITAAEPGTGGRASGGPVASAVRGGACGAAGEVPSPGPGQRVPCVWPSGAPPSSRVALGTAAASLGPSSPLAEEMSSLFQARPHIPGPRTGTRASSLPAGVALLCAFQVVSCARAAVTVTADVYRALCTSPLPFRTWAGGGLTPFPRMT